MLPSSYDPDYLERALPQLVPEQEYSYEFDSEEPPVKLIGYALEVWNGEHPVIEDGQIDRSKTMYKIGAVLYEAGLRGPALVSALKERDEALEYRKYAERGDEREYERIVSKLKAGEVVPETNIEPDFDPFLTGPQLAANTPEYTEWVIGRLIPEGSVTLFSGKMKDGGKTTFLTNAAIKVINGEDFMGQPVKQGKVVYLTEQPYAALRSSIAGEDNLCKLPAALLESEDFIILPWHSVSHINWPDVVELAAKRADIEGARLLIVDTFTQFAKLKGDEENNAGAVMEAIRPLQAAQGRYGLTVIIVAHERKSGGDVMDRIRGANAMGGAVNQILSMNRSSKKDIPATVREVESRGNYAATPEKFLVELTKDGYVWLDQSPEVSKDAKKAKIFKA
ncbi:MAG: AAA family ATPase, partial [Actinobacteria bacterium]|nr:AAA family ATPase [Actinomycetota bacterium]